jgi:hypothetical protein
MGFGQTAGPPASAQQLAQLVELLREAGFDGLREARHPLGLSQRQSNGKFTRDEAAALIDQLARGEETAPGDGAAPIPGAVVPPDVVPPDVLPPETVATAFPDELLAEELVRRGWTCTPPTG